MSEIISEVKENKMGTMPVNKLVLNMSIPMMISMLVQAMYNIVDSIFVSRIHEDALSALNLCFPIQILIIALATGTGVGVNALVSRALGEKNIDRANKVSMNGVFLAFVSFVIFFFVGLFAVKPYFALQNTDNLQIKQFGVEYLTINCMLSFGLFMQIIFERLLQSTGKTVYSMITQSVGAIINIIMDPILIFGLLGFPAMGVKGAAVATVFGQIIAGCLAVFFNIFFNKELTLKIKNLIPDMKIIGQIYAIGVPSIIMQAIGSVMNTCMNQILLGFSDTACAVFGAYYKLQSFFFMPVFGLNGAVIPIIAYNFGAGKRKRLVKSIKIGIVYAEILLVAGLIAFEFFPQQLLSIFKASDNMMQMGTVALRIIGIHFPVAAFCIILGTVFQALGHGMYSMWVSVARQLLVLIPAAYLLSLLGNVNYVWWAFPIAEVASLIISTTFFIITYKKTIVHIPDND